MQIVLLAKREGGGIESPAHGSPEPAAVEGNNLSVGASRRADRMRLEEEQRGSRG